MTTLEKGQVMTANRLRDGEAVFLTRAGTWAENIDEAALALEPQAAAALEARAKDGEKASLITGAYLFDATRVEGKIKADHMRERMRAVGPTVRLDLGKQAEGTGSVFAAIEG
jgi:Protein of unknown function (DUF2849)